MIGIYYIFLCFLTGFTILEPLFGDLRSFTGTTFSKKQIVLSSWYFRLPAYFVTGVPVLTWAVYIFTYIFRNSGNPLGYANVVVLIAASIYCSVMLVFIIKKKKCHFKGETDKGAYHL